VNLDVSSANTYIGLGDALMGLGLYDKASESFLAAIRIDERYADAYKGLSLIHFKQGHLAEALTAAFGALLALWR